MVFTLPTSDVFTDYNTNCTIDRKIMKDNKITSNNEYRLFLQRNADKIMKINSDNATASVLQINKN